MTKAEKLYWTLRKEGLRSVADRVATHAWWLYERWFVGTYYKLKGSARIDVGRASATFNTDTRAEAVAVRFFRKSELPLFRDLLSELRPTDVFFDVGANIGLYTCLIASVFPEGTTVAFEPYPPNNRSLRENLALNGFDGQVVSKALSDSAGTVEFDRYDDGNTRGTPTIATADTSSKIEIESNTVDNLVKNGEVPAPNVVKIDVEGTEGLVLRGMHETLESDSCRTVYCEVHLPSSHRTSIDDFGSSYEEIEEIFVSRGFTVSELYRRPDEVMIKATKDE